MTGLEKRSDTFEALSVFERRVMGLLFKYPESRVFRGALAAVLAAAGLVFWAGFFQFGRAGFTAYDWPKEITYLETLRGAVAGGRLPWVMEGDRFPHGMPLFMANPETILTPDIVLLPYAGNARFVWLHTGLFYLAGLWAGFRLWRRARCGALVFLVFWVLFNFNGYITARLAVGHFQWLGYYLLPAFLLVLMGFRQDPLGGALRVAGVMGLWLLNGSVHFAVWSALFLAVAALASPGMRRPLVGAVAGGALLGFGRLAPAFLWFPPGKLSFPGYNSPVMFFEALTGLYDHRREIPGQGPSLAGWWEFTFYVGTAGLALIALGLYGLRGGGVRVFDRGFVAGALALLALSFGGAVFVAAQSGLPLSSLLRVPSRLVVIPVVMALCALLWGLDAGGGGGGAPGWMRPAVALLFVLACGDLMANAFAWRLAAVEMTAPRVAAVEPAGGLPELAVYQAVVLSSWVASGAACVVWAGLWLRRGRRGGRASDLSGRGSAGAS